MIWLGERRGSLTDWTTQRWVALTGRSVTFDAVPWLRGPIGSTRGIGADYFQNLAAAEGLVVREGGQRGLMSRFADLGGSRFDPSAVREQVAQFYERTSAYTMDIWSEWCGAFRPLGGLLAALFSRRLRQLNLPLSALDASLGVTSRVFALCDPANERVVHTGWLRSLSGSGRVLYAAIYSLERIPGHDGPCVKVVFPLPNGNAIVILRPEVGPHGELVLLSEGRGFGAPGFYFTVHDGDGRGKARYVRSVRERFTVYVMDGRVRADHELRWLGLSVFRLHYKLDATSTLTPPAGTGMTTTA